MSTRSASRDVAGSTFAIVANGFADGPAEALRDFLVQHDANVTAVAHPLTAEHGRWHVVTFYVAGDTPRRRAVWTPLRPPLSYALDPFVPFRLPRVDVWFGFNPLACARGLVARRLGRAAKVVLWSVDFTPDRFGPASPLTRAYDLLDRLSCRRADARVELSEAARDARSRRLGPDATRAPVYVVPMGAWLERVPRTPEDGQLRNRAVFLGHLTEGKGAELLLDALAVLHDRGARTTLDVIGGGDLLPALQQRASALGLAAAVRFHGFVPDLREVERLLAQASVGVAPYAPSERSFSRYADPGKLKNYLAAGLPIVLTDVPPNARELAREAGAELVPYDAAALADAIARAVSSSEGWRQRRERALRYGRRFDWPALLAEVLEKLGFRVG